MSDPTERDDRPGLNVPKCASMIGGLLAGLSHHAGTATVRRAVRFLAESDTYWLLLEQAMAAMPEMVGYFATPEDVDDLRAEARQADEA